MKCPKCAYLGFETSDRCKNCGYDFSLIDQQAPAAVRAGRTGPAPGPPVVDPSPRDRHVARGARYRGNTSDAPRAPGGERPLAVLTEGGLLDLPLFGEGPLPPSRPPLAVRRATPVPGRPRPRAESPGPVALELDLEAPGPSSTPVPISDSPSAEVPPVRGLNPAAASTGRRIGAALIDLLLVALVDVIVLSFTLRLCGLAPAEFSVLPVVPLGLFYAVLDGGYLILFTATLGQTLGKMALGIQVVPDTVDVMDLRRAMLRSAATVLSILPLGLGFVPAAFGDHRALHDRLARTRVIQIAAA